MRATEFLTEQTAPDGSKLIAKSGDMWLWEVPAHTYQAVYDKEKNHKYHPAQPVPADNGKIYYVSHQIYQKYDHSAQKYVNIELTPDQAVNHWDIYWRFVTNKGDELISLAGKTKLSPGIVKKLAKLTGAQHAPTIHNYDMKRHVLHQGQVRHIKQVMQDYEIAPLSSGARVYKIPKNLLWTVGIQKYAHVDDSHIQADKPEWDTKWSIENPIVGPFSVVSKAHTIVKYWFPANKAVAAVKDIRELAQRENLTLAIQLPDTTATTGKVKTVKPNGVMHKMLAYVDGHPGANRTDWFVKHLGRDPQGMQGWSADTAHDGVAAAMGWIKNEGVGGKYSLHITPVGKLVLARLNAGHTVKHTKQV